MSVIWNPWHGCTKISSGCKHCYMYRRDAEFGKDSSIVTKTASFKMPVMKNRKGEYKMQPDDGLVYTCFTSDFFHPDADEWRRDAWAMMKERSDLTFYFITKRPDRFYASLPDDWGQGWDTIRICCTCENQYEADRRLPVFLKLPIRHKSVIVEPMLQNVSLAKFYREYPCQIEEVTCGGESGPDARLCDYEWVMELMLECVQYGVPFHFMQTGTNFKKGGHLYFIKDHRDQISQAAKARIDYRPVKPEKPEEAG